MASLNKVMLIGKRDWRTKHGQHGTGAYRSWYAMKDRCLNPKNRAFSHYGGRGIKIHAPWLSFSAFFSDMGARPEGMTLERLDNDLGYTPSNCVWSTRKEQQRNRRSNKAMGRRCLSEISEQSGISRTTLVGRLKRGWSLQKATATAIHRKYRNGRSK